MVLAQIGLEVGLGRAGSVDSGMGVLVWDRVFDFLSLLRAILIGHPVLDLGPE